MASGKLEILLVKDKIGSVAHIMHQDKLQKDHIFKVKKKLNFIWTRRRYGWMHFQPVIRENFLSQHPVAIQEKKWTID